MQLRLAGLRGIVETMRPMTVRQVFYQATVHHIVEKTEQGYDKVQIALANMRRTGAMPYDWLVDFTRWQRKPRTFRDVTHALQETSRLYRKDLWASAESYLEIWLEKDALSGVVLPVTSKYDVPLMVARGYASLSFLSEAAEYMEAADRLHFLKDMRGQNDSGSPREILYQLAHMSDLRGIEAVRGFVEYDDFRPVEDGHPGLHRTDRNRYFDRILALR